MDKMGTVLETEQPYEGPTQRKHGDSCVQTERDRGASDQWKRHQSPAGGPQVSHANTRPSRIRANSTHLTCGSCFLPVYRTGRETGQGDHPEPEPSKCHLSQVIRPKLSDFCCCCCCFCFCNLGWPRAVYIEKAALKHIEICLPLPHQCWE